MNVYLLSSLLLLVPCISAQIEVRQLVEVLAHSRFVTTIVETTVENNDNNPYSDSLTVILPESAFVTNFTLDNRDGFSIGHVEEKDKAQKILDEAIRNGQSASTVSTRGTNEFEIKLNIEPDDVAYITLTYQEILQRESGVNRLFVHVPSRNEVRDFELVVGLSERHRIDVFHIPEPAPNLNRMTTTELAGLDNLIDRDDFEQEFFGPLEVIKARDYQAPSPGEPGDIVMVQWDSQDDRNRPEPQDLVILFSTDIPSSGQEVIQTVDGFFVHFITPDEEQLNTGDKNLVFILDKSGSMKGRKFAQVQKAMETILYQLGDSQVNEWGERIGNDKFSVMMFGTKNTVWKERLQEARDVNAIQDAVDWVMKQTAAGWTNISGAMKKGLEILRTGGNQVSASGIIFLTDGLPTRGTKDKQKLIDEIFDDNTQGDFHIHTLAFGSDADYPTLQKISADNRGLARKIYADSDAQFQLEGFYAEVARPMITNMEISYVAGNVDPETLVINNDVVQQPNFDVPKSRRKGPVFQDAVLNKGSEAIVVGRTKKNKPSQARSSRRSSRLDKLLSRFNRGRTPSRTRSSSKPAYKTVSGRVKGNIVTKNGQKSKLSSKTKCDKVCAAAADCTKPSAAKVDVYAPIWFKEHSGGNMVIEDLIALGEFCDISTWSSSAQQAARRHINSRRSKRETGSKGSGSDSRVLPANTVSGFVQRFWASMTVQQLIDEAEYETSSKQRELEKKAVKLAKKYNFVTRLTSLVVVEGDGDRYKLNQDQFVELPNSNAGPQSEGGAISGSGNTGSSCDYKVCLAFEEDAISDRWERDDAQDIVDRALIGLDAKTKVCILIYSSKGVKQWQGFESIANTQKTFKSARNTRTIGNLPSDTRLGAVFRKSTSAAAKNQLKKKGFSKKNSVGLYRASARRDRFSGSSKYFTTVKSASTGGLKALLKPTFDAAC